MSYKTIKIERNVWTNEVKYYWKNDSDKWEDLSENINSAFSKSKFESVDLVKAPIDKDKANKILNGILNDYKKDGVEIVFIGTKDEYEFFEHELKENFADSNIKCKSKTIREIPSARKIKKTYTELVDALKDYGDEDEEILEMKEDIKAKRDCNCNIGEVSERAEELCEELDNVIEKLNEKRKSVEKDIEETENKIKEEIQDRTDKLMLFITQMKDEMNGEFDQIGEKYSVEEFDKLEKLRKRKIRKDGKKYSDGVEFDEAIKDYAENTNTKIDNFWEKKIEKLQRKFKKIVSKRKDLNEDQKKRANDLLNEEMEIEHISIDLNEEDKLEKSDKYEKQMSDILEEKNKQVNEGNKRNFKNWKDRICIDKDKVNKIEPTIARQEEKLEKIKKPEEKLEGLLEKVKKIKLSITMNQR